jgi:hypothetical protein
MPEPTTLTDIVRRRYETGEYGNAHFAMSSATVTAIREPTPKTEFKPPAYLGGRFGDLLSIPVRVDETLPEGAWRLVDNSTGDVIVESPEPVKILSYHYGPTATDPNPGDAWCYDCGGRVGFFEGHGVCGGCGAQVCESPVDCGDDQCPYRTGLGA